MLQIRLLTSAELGQAMDLASKEGWNPGKYDASSYYAMDSKGFFGLFLDGELIGSISAVSYSNEFSFIGLFIVKPEYRSRGYGKMLWNAAMEKLSSHASTGLNAVPAQISNYRRSGFEEFCLNERWERKVPPQRDLSHLISSHAQNRNGLFNQLLEYDKSLGAFHKPNFLRKALTLPQTTGFVSFALDSNKKSKRVNGYGMVRPCEKGFRVGPVYSDDFESAKKLAELLLNTLPEGTEVILDIPDRNPFSRSFAEFFQLERATECDTEAMIKGINLKTSVERHYAAASLELG